MTLRSDAGAGLRNSVVLAAAGLLLIGSGCESLRGTKGSGPVVAKWGCFEQAFKSATVYSNALQDARLRVTFTSPLGATREVDGFWDGGKTWRVRFSPDQPGRWIYRTRCSDGLNQGLHDRAGEFVCSAALGFTAFQNHGPVRVARDHRHFEHADGTPFLWLADTAWAGARASAPKDWETYALIRAYQKFSVVQWAVAPGADSTGQSAYIGRDRIAIRPEFFQRLDAKVALLGHAGLLSAVTPLLEMGAGADSAARLPEDQAILLARYVVARWGAEPVVWLLAFEASSPAQDAERWKQIGRAVFGEGAHAPVVVCPSGTQWLGDEFRREPWVDAFAYSLSNNLVPSGLSFAGPFAEEWKKEPARPLIPFVPFENPTTGRSQRAFSSDAVRQAVYGSLLRTVPAGVSYGTDAVADWEAAAGAAKGKAHELPPWRKALSLPAAEQIAYVAKFLDGVEFWKLRPEPEALAGQSGACAAATDTKDLSLVYVPGARTVEIRLKAIPPLPLISWRNPRTGEKNPAVAVLGDTACQVPTPGPGDWLLLVTDEKR